MNTLEDICNKINMMDQKVSEYITTKNEKIFIDMDKLLVLLTKKESLLYVKEHCDIRLYMDVLQDTHCPSCLKYNGLFLFEDFVERNPCIETVLTNLKSYLEDDRLKNPIVMYITDLEYIEKIQEKFDLVYVF